MLLYEEQKAQEQAEAAEYQRKADAFAVELAAAMGDGWEFLPDSLTGYRVDAHIHKGDLIIGITHAYNGPHSDRGRWQIHGQHPRRIWGYQSKISFAPMPSMSATQAKSAAQVAKEIRTKLLPLAVYALAQTLQLIAEHDAYNSNVRGIYDRLLKAGQGYLESYQPTHTSEPTNALTTPYSQQGISFDLQCYSDSVNIKGRLPVAQAEELAALIAKWLKDQSIPVRVKPTR